MAIPDTVVIPNNTSSQRFIPSAFIANSISLLNPNDGICYVKRDGPCYGTITGQWDWKVPSQSYAYLPGPFRAVGLYYTDRSGSGLPGEITTYALSQKFEVPEFRAIGRAVLSNVTSLDIGQGAPPQPPAANNVRIWADTNGDLHATLPGGASYKLVDDNDPLGGALTGTLLNPSLAANSVGSLQIIDGSIGISDMGPGSVSTPQLVDQSVTMAKLATNAATNKSFSVYNGAAVTIATASGFANTGIGLDLNCIGRGPVHVEYTFAWIANTANSINQFGIAQDGSPLAFGGQLCPLAGYGGVLTLQHTFATPAAGVHQYRLYVGTNSGTVTIQSGVTFIVTEILA